MSEARLRSFRTPAAFRAWLRKNHASESELLLRCFKVHVAHRGVTYRQALEEALCFGWIDGIRRGVDEVSFSVRFTPRRPGSIWSRINVGHVQRLRAEGRMTKAGLAAFEKREPEKTAMYSFERRPARLAPAYIRALKANAKAWAFFTRQPPGYRRLVTFMVMEAKRPQTRERRLQRLIDHSARGRRIPPLDR